MLQIRNLTITHKKDLRTILKDFSLSLNPGDKAVIIGEEGNGKSTLIKLIYNPDIVEDYIEYTGEIIRNNKKLGYLSQEMESVDGNKSIYEYCLDIPEFLDLLPNELAHIGKTLNLGHDLFFSEQKVKELSGGEKVKLQIARILMTHPDILLLDEPSNDLDIETLEWLESFINKCDLPILFISHDELLIENTANMVIHIEQIKRKTESKYTIAKTSYKSYINERLSSLNKQEQNARNEQREFKKQVDKFMQIQQKVEHQQNSISRQDPHGGQLLKKKMKSIKSMGKRLDKEKENLTQVPDVEESIFVKFNEKIMIPNGKTVIDFHIDELKIADRLLSSNIHLQIIGSQRICIIGKNGVGKSTLLKIIAKELQSRTDIKVSYMPQNYEDLLDLEKTPIDFLATTGEKEEITRIRTYLGSMKYTADEMSHSIMELSGGQKAKILFLKMSLDGTNVLILDEPTRNFSPLSNPVIREVLSSFGGAIISISHDRKYIEEVCNKLYRLTEDGLFLVEK
jgi:ATPase subunit of ABC transporter with duplicated ATPase domains